jgi:hypothetical protein
LLSTVSSHLLMSISSKGLGDREKWGKIKGAKTEQYREYQESLGDLKLGDTTRPRSMLRFKMGNFGK